MKIRGFCVLLGILMLCSSVGCHDAVTSSYTDADLSALLGEDFLRCDILQVEVREGVAKIDAVAAGLDSYAFETLLLDWETKQILCRRSFPEGTWQSGLTAQGFYTVHMGTKELTLYDKSGNITHQRCLDHAVGDLLFCALSTDARYLMYTVASETAVTVLQLDTDQTSFITPVTPLREVLAFDNGVLQAISTTGQVLALDAVQGTCTVPVDDRRITTYSPHYSLGKTETNFLIANPEGHTFVPFAAADELVVGVGENGFATTALSQGRYILRLYDLHTPCIRYAYTDLPVEQVCYADSDTVLMVTGSPTEQQHKVWLTSPTETAPLTLLSADTPLPPSPQTTAPNTGAPNASGTLIEGIPPLHQFPQFPTGCESVSAVMALRYGGVTVSVEEFVDTYLPKSSDFYTDNGVMFGPSPYQYFIGNPKTTASYGCMAPVIQTALAACVGDETRVKNVTKQDLPTLCRQYIDQNVPVLIWATIHMRETNPVNSWYLADGTRFTWPGNEHCMLLVGYDDTCYYFNDPYVGKTVAYDKTLTQDRYAEMGWQAVVLLPQ